MAIGPDLVKTVILKVVGDASSAQDAISRVDARAEEMKRNFPEFAARIDTAAATAKMRILRADLQHIASDPIKQKVTPDVDVTAWQRVMKLLFGSGGFPKWQGGGGVGGFFTGITKLAGQFGASGWGALIIALGGVLTLVGNIATGLLAASTALSSFTALAAPEFTKLKTAIGLGTAGLQGLNAQQQLVVSGALAIEAQYKSLAAKIAPYVDQILGIFTQTSQAGSKGFGKQQQGAQFGGVSAGPLQQLLQTVGKLAQAIGPALVQLANGFAKFVSSPGFKQFENMLIKLAPGVILAIGYGIGRLAIDIGKLLEAFGGARGAAIAINIVFGILEAGIIVLTKFAGIWKGTWDTAVKIIRGFRDGAAAVFGEVALGISGFINRVQNDLITWLQFFQRIPGDIKKALSGLPAILETVGKLMVQGFINGLESISLVTAVTQHFGGVVGTIKNLLGIRSPSTVAIGLGRNFTEGFYIGLNQAAGVSVRTGGIGGGYGGELHVTGAGAPDFLRLVKALWPSLVLEVRTKGGGGKNSAQIALGQTQ